MPALSNYNGFLGKRDWSNTVGNSGMTPTAFAFLIPVFIVVVFAPFLCVYCVRRRQGTVTPLPAVRKVKKPALRREQARERLRQLTDVADVTGDEKKTAEGQETREEVVTVPVSDNASVNERECAICLSTLHAPSPPEPALLSSESTSTSPDATDDAAMPPPVSSAPEPILALHTCSHVFHAECLVSWFVLRKTTCPICRTAYISTEDMKAYEEEEAGILAGEAEQMTVVEPENGVAGGNNAAVDGGTGRVSNWRYFWAGQSVMGREHGRAGVRQGAVDVESGQPRRGRRWAFGRRV